MNTLLWYIEITWDYVVQMLPCALLGAACFFALRPWRKKRLAEKGLKSGTGREGAILLLVLFSAGLSALTLWPANFWNAVVNGAVPVLPEFTIGQFYSKVTLIDDFLEVFRQPHGAWSTFMVLGNLIMFLPLGFFPALAGDKPRWWRALLTGFSVSAFIEIVQLFVDRSSDINDIILNTLGALCGFWVYLLLRRIAPKFTARFKLQKTEVPHGRETGDRTAPQ